jgi:TrmH family RNA methyltransferase
MIQIVLVEPKTGGNIGAIARAMANFNMQNLVLVNPKCDPFSEDCLKRAKHAVGVLDRMRVVNSLDDLDADYMIGTTSALGADYNIPRSPIRPDNIAQTIAKLREEENVNIAIILGREGDGLTNHEILLCDFIVTIPTFPEYPVMNISHAATIIFYELFKQTADEKIDEHIKFATDSEKKVLLELVDKLLKSTEFSTEEKRETQRKVWKRLVGKSFMTKREAMALIGFMKKLV